MNSSESPPLMSPKVKQVFSAPLQGVLSLDQIWPYRRRAVTIINRMLTQQIFKEEAHLWDNPSTWH